jgi:hypothetical protein
MIGKVLQKNILVTIIVGAACNKKPRIASFELCRKMEVMGSEKSLAVPILKAPQQCGRNRVSDRGQYH